MPKEPYPPPDFHPGRFDDFSIDPQLLLMVETNPFFGEYDAADFDGFFDTDSIEQDTRSVRHSGIQALQRHERTHPPYYLERGIFTNDHKAIIEQFSHEAPALVEQMLRDQDPAMTFSYRQIKGAVENERRKKNRREQNGPWTEEEVDVIRNNMDRMPKELVELLRSSVLGCTKNIDQVRDLKSQLTQRARRKAETEGNEL